MRKLLMQASRISRVYRQGSPDEVWALREIDLCIYAGDFLTILGATGAGKSTLLRILGLREPPTHGDLYYEGRLITGLTCQDLQPALILADEPTAGLTPLQSTARLRYLQAENRRGRTIVLATADPELAAHGAVISRLSKGVLYRIGG